MTTATLQLLLPEIVLIAVAAAIYLGGAFSTEKKGTSLIFGRRREEGLSGPPKSVMSPFSNSRFRASSQNSTVLVKSAASNRAANCGSFSSCAWLANKPAVTTTVSKPSSCCCA